MAEAFADGRMVEASNVHSGLVLGWYLGLCMRSEGELTICKTHQQQLSLFWKEVETARAAARAASTT